MAIGVPYSSVRGVIFFSSTSSSAKFFWYFSQLEPVAEGMFALQAASGVASTAVQVRGNRRYTAGAGPAVVRVYGRGRRRLLSGVWMASDGDVMGAAKGAVRPSANRRSSRACRSSPAARL